MTEATAPVEQANEEASTDNEEQKSAEILTNDSESDITTDSDEQSTELKEESTEENSNEKEEDSSWLNELSEDVRFNKSIQKFKSKDDLAKAYINVEKLASKKIKDLSDDDKETLSKFMGRPETIDEYEFDLGDDIPSDDPLVNWFKESAFEAGLPKDVAEKMVQGYIENSEKIVNESLSESKVQAEKMVEQLKEEFGSAYDTQVNVAKTVFSKYFDENTRQALIDAGFGVYPGLIKGLVQIAKDSSEGTPIMPDKNQSFGKTKSDVQKEIEVFNSSYQDALFDRRHPKHKWAVQEQTRLFKELNGSK